ncbi:hypothetical protein BDB01DRAFT_332590 [Pilobolus umbonatus]|nr:hypothetical protein BDB01DRAFT_332590 [Pilobolus umbonatus]
MGTQILNKCNVSTISILLISPFSFLSVLPLSIILVMQPPSALDFPSHSYIQKPAQEIIKKLPHLKTNRLNILEYRPVVSIIPEKKTFKEACDVCRRRNLYIGPMLSYADDQEADKFLNLLSGCTLNKYQSKNNLTRIPHPDLYHCATIEAPIISYREQISLINNYYEGSNIFNPVIDKKYLLEQHGYWYNNQTSALTPLLFYAIFAKAAYGENNPGAKGKYNKKLANHCMEYASYLAQLHSGNPRPCVLLALIIMANHLEATKLSQNMVQAWSYLRVGVDVAEGLGLYETCKFNDDTFDGQLKIRTLWLTFVTDAIMSMIYARPFNIKEKLISIKLPKVLASDDVLTAHWVNNLNKLITMSKASIRIIDHHYSSPRHLSSTNMAEVAFISLQ